MITFNSIKEMELYYNKATNTYIFSDDIKTTFDLVTDANIAALNIKARTITAGEINAFNIDAYNIDARNIDALKIDARDINAYNIDAVDIDARDINAHNIDARDINAYNIDALNIDYYAICIAYHSFTCESVKGRRKNSIHACLDGDIVYKKPKKDEQLQQVKKLEEDK